MDYPLSCGEITDLPIVVPYSLVARSELEAANRKANTSIIRLPGRSTRWAVWPTMGGDGDYVVSKRAYLIVNKQWPMSALMIAEASIGAIPPRFLLVARTTRGDFILDDMLNSVEDWTERDYLFTRIQSPSNPHEWYEVEQWQRPSSGREILTIPE